MSLLPENERTKERLLFYLPANHRLLHEVPQEWRRDKAFMLQAVQANPLAWKFGRHLRGDREFVLAAVEADGLSLDIWIEWKADREVVLAAVRQNGAAIRHGYGSTRVDEEVRLAAVRQDGGSLIHMFPDGVPSREVELEAVRNSAEAIRFCTRIYSPDDPASAVAFLHDCIAANGMVVEYVAEFHWHHLDKAAVLMALRQNGLALQHLSSRWRRDPAALRAAVGQTVYAFQYADPTAQTLLDELCELVFEP